jgi:hypothetical protein
MIATSSTPPSPIPVTGFAYQRPPRVAIPVYIVGVFGGAVFLSENPLHWYLAAHLVGWGVWTGIAAAYVYLIIGPSTRQAVHGTWDRSTGAITWSTGSHASIGQVLAQTHPSSALRHGFRWGWISLLGIGLVLGGGSLANAPALPWALSQLAILSALAWGTPPMPWLLHVQHRGGRTRFALQIDASQTPTCR